MRLAVYTDYVYHRIDGEVRAERAFAIFLARLATRFEGLRLIGRLSPDPARALYPVGATTELVPLPYYASLANPWRALPAFVRSLGVFWKALDEVDCVWLLGPHPLAVCFALLAVLRRRAVVLGVRQDLPAYARHRHQGARGLLLGALALEGAYRLLSRFLGVIVVGPDLARRYRGSPALLEIAVSLVEDEDLVTPAVAGGRDYEGRLEALSVGRVEAEKDPLLLIEILRELRTDGRDWHLSVYGEGPMVADLAAGLANASLEGAAELRGYVPYRPQLVDSYRGSHLLLHISLTEGLPQVLLEAFAAGLPVVASDVGGIREAVGDAVLLVAPGDAAAAARAARRVVDDPDLRARLVSAGHDYVRTHTLDAESARVASFLRSAVA